MKESVLNKRAKLPQDLAAVALPPASSAAAGEPLPSKTEESKTLSVYLKELGLPPNSYHEILLLIP